MAPNVCGISACAGNGGSCARRRPRTNQAILATVWLPENHVPGPFLPVKCPPHSRTVALSHRLFTSRCPAASTPGHAQGFGPIKGGWLWPGVFFWQEDLIRHKMLCTTLVLTVRLCLEHNRRPGGSPPRRPFSCLNHWFYSVNSTIGYTCAAPTIYSGTISSVLTYARHVIG